MKQSHWLFSAKEDLAFLFVPVWLTWAAAFLLPDQYIHADVQIWVWLVFVLGIDVSHVWSTLFRTYFDREEFGHHRRLLIFAPIIAFLLSFSIASFSFDLFWRCLAYVAVFHFVKQQYGFMRIYKARSRDFNKKLISDDFAIYLSMLYPIIYWHINLDRSFAWFVEGDFLQFGLPIANIKLVNALGNLVYALLMATWLFEEFYLKFTGKKQISIGKILWVITTCGNWFIGIVYFNSDFVFTITNVVAHGLPYMALIVFYARRKKAIKNAGSTSRGGIPIAVSVVVVALTLAFFEEYFWDLFVYQDLGGVFQSLTKFSFPEISNQVKVLALALLSIPQITHYIIDGFIWKVNHQNPYIKPILLN